MATSTSIQGNTISSTAKGGLVVKGEYIRGFNADPQYKSLLDAATKRTDLTPSIGTELEGVQLAELTDAQLEDLLALTAERGVVFFRNQNLNQQESLELGNS
ncbi:TauD-domain-containing protein [Basidiobolus meristosporus CBS 931.73]|uniref:TauD-domain-containing protein n=1 Tax=Basidiobolus meristosporus CBS 931.73 TaxID=1314790 RepID=A0A1Y1X0X3_9FUNG|nr:TauD-domain-containing protein [Basidiobolus meristosporus CBS 931.73]|eukprot:ORX79315.1 TauD-domain-containing protein [Basidiobolus meristosporus CBS 931.73]